MKDTDKRWGELTKEKLNIGFHALAITCGFKNAKEMVNHIREVCKEE